MKQKVIGIVKEVYAQAPEIKITGDTDLINDIGSSSLEMLIFINELEENFKVVLKPEYFSGKCTVDDVCMVLSDAIKKNKNTLDKI